MDPSSGADPVHLSQKSSRVGGGRTRPRRYSSILFRRSLPRHGTCGGIPFFTESLRMRRPDPLEAVLCRATSIRPRQFRDIVPGVFTPVFAKHSKSFSLVDCLSVGVDRMQRNFEPMRKQVEVWQRSELTDVTAKVVITRRLSRENWKLQNTLPTACMTSTSNQSTRISGRERSGVFPMPSRLH